MVSKLDLLAGWPQLMAIPVTTVFSLSATHLPFPANDQVNPWYHHYPSLYPMKYPIMFHHCPPCFIHFPPFSTIFHPFSMAKSVKSPFFPWRKAPTLGTLKRAGASLRSDPLAPPWANLSHRSFVRGSKNGGFVNSEKPWTYMFMFLRYIPMIVD